MRIAVFFVGKLHDNGFNANALEGALRAADTGSAEIVVLDGVAYDESTIRARLIETIETSDGLVFVGGQGNIATPTIAAMFPEKKFAIVQGERTGQNLSSYDVLQEQSAFLAGVAAAMHTKTGVVAHLSGHRVRPGLKGRAAFVGGVHHADPAVRVLTAFCGTQDDANIARAWTTAEIAAGADIVFTMLNGARDGAIAACQALGARQIGNALDWVKTDPVTFMGSAIARIDLGVELAISDMVRGHTPTHVVELGLADGNYVALSLSDDLPTAIATRVEATSKQVRAGVLHVPSEYQGPEFQPPVEACR